MSLVLGGHPRLLARRHPVRPDHRPMAKGIDLREYGSHRTGATNALRTLGARGRGEPSSCSTWPRAWLPCCWRDCCSAATRSSSGRRRWPAWPRSSGTTGRSSSASPAGAASRLRPERSAAMSPWTILILAPIVFAVIWRTRYVSLGSVIGALGAPIITAVLARDRLPPRSRRSRTRWRPGLLVTVCARRQHRPAARRDRAQDRPEGGGEPAWLRTTVDERAVAPARIGSPANLLGIARILATPVVIALILVASPGMGIAAVRALLPGGLHRLPRWMGRPRPGRGLAARRLHGPDRRQGAGRRRARGDGRGRPAADLDRRHDPGARARHRRRAADGGGREHGHPGPRARQGEDADDARRHGGPAPRPRRVDRRAAGGDRHRARGSRSSASG